MVSSDRHAGDRLTDWNEAALFLAVAEAGSFSRAAVLLGLDQATVSRRFAALETRAGVPLAVRRTTGAQLTPAGQRLANAAQGAATAIEGFARTLRSLRHSLDPIAVAAPEGIASYLLGPAVAAAGGSDLPLWLPGRLADSPPLHLVPLGAPADVEFIIGRPGEMLPVSPEMRVRRLGRMLFAPVASRTYLSIHGAPADFEDLARHRLLDHSAYRMHIGLTPWTDLTHEAKGKPVITAPTSSALHRTVLANAGIALLPVFSSVLDPNVMTVPCGHPTMSVEVWLGAHRDTLRNAAVRQVYDLIASMFLQSPWFGD